MHEPRVALRLVVLELVPLDFMVRIPGVEEAALSEKRSILPPWFPYASTLPLRVWIDRTS